MTHAIQIKEYGGPEVLSWDEVAVGQPGPGQVRLRQTAVGLNYVDVYQRSGLYKTPLPFIAGSEAAGVVEAVASDVKEFKEGDHVAYAGALGAYTQGRTVAADKLVKLPAGVDDQHAAAMMLQGMTAQYLIRTTYPVKKGDTILIHAAAGGVGLIVCQWAKYLGATVIGTVSTEAKAALAKQHGCDHPIIYTKDDFVAKVKEITNGAGVPVVYDSVGKDTFYKSLDCLAPLGLMASFGQSSGPYGPVDIGILAGKGSLFLTRPTLGTYTAKRSDLLKVAGELFDVVKKGVVKIDVSQTFPLKNAAEAHRALEGRKTTGSVVLLP